MNWIRQRQVHLLGLTFLFVFNFIFYYPNVFLNIGLGLPVYLFICIIFALHIWYLNYGIVYMMRHFFVGYKNSLNKRLIAFLIILPFVVLLITIFQSLFFYWLNNKGITSDFYVHYEDIGINLLYSLIIVFFLELLHYFRNWNKAVAESAMLKQKSMEAQLEALKSQINPHFLFNSLNSLTSLIQIDGLQAINYVHKLSSVYRYMLHSNDKNLIKLEEELNFLQAYLHLLQIRFGTAFNYSIIIDAAYQGYFIPPLTLQLLVENAVKHNIVSTNIPLKVEISIAKGKLEVKNNLQKRTSLYEGIDH